MRYFKITLRQAPGSKELIYPEKYQAEIGNFNEGHLYLKDEPALVMCIKDENAGNIVRPYVEEITEEEIKAISEANEIRTEEITDEARIRRIELKAKLGQDITVKDKKAIDPDDPTPGFGKRKILADKIEGMKKKPL